MSATTAGPPPRPPRAEPSWDRDGSGLGRVLADKLAGVARGDREAFAGLYDATAPKLFGIVLRIVRDRQIAEDVVQDAYLKIWENASRYSPEAGHPLSWMISISRNRAIDIVRRRGEVQMPVTDDGPEWEATIAEPRDREAEFIDADRLSHCLEGLEATQRRCFVDAYLEGFSREELAERYERPVNTIKTWLHRSANTLRTCLGER